jgi:hypothetical protein
MMAERNKRKGILPTFVYVAIKNPEQVLNASREFYNLVWVKTFEIVSQRRPDCRHRSLHHRRSWRISMPLVGSILSREIAVPHHCSVVAKDPAKTPTQTTFNVTTQPDMNRSSEAHTAHVEETDGPIDKGIRDLPSSSGTLLSARGIASQLELEGEVVDPYTLEALSALQAQIEPNGRCLSACILDFARSSQVIFRNRIHAICILGL